MTRKDLTNNKTLAARVRAELQKQDEKPTPAPIPRGIQLHRTAGFVLQVTSRGLNGLPAVKVDRTTKWGNPYKTHPSMNAEEATRMFRRTLESWSPDQLEEYLAPLRGRNLACWCAHGQPCHRDVLLEFASRPPHTQTTA